MPLTKALFKTPLFYILIIALGVGFKFYHLSTKLFWEDEISTVLYTTGIKDSVLQSHIPRDQILHFSYFDSLLHPASKLYSLPSEIKGIFSETHLTPLHYVFLTFWYRLVGDTNYDYRLFSVVIFIISLPFVFLLGKTLFDSVLAGWVCLSLYSLSPFIQLQSQDARYHLLWVLFSVLSNLFLLRATKGGKRNDWIGYTICSVLNLYTAAISGLFLLGHFIYIIFIKPASARPFILCSLITLIAYYPWLSFMISVHSSLQSGLSWHSLFHSSYYSIDLLFFQFLGFVKSVNFLFPGQLYFFGFIGITSRALYLALLVDCLTLALIIYAIFWLYKNGSKSQKIFFVVTIVPYFLLFYAYDLVRNGFASTVW